MSKGQINFYTKGQLVYEILREQITSGELKPGQRFSAAEISAQFGVSRTPVNEVVKLLAEQGLVTLLPNVGFEIKILSWPEIMELMYIRRELEKLAVTWAITRAPQEKIAALRRLSREIRRIVKEEDKERYYTLNKEFHFSLYEAAAAPRLLDLHLHIWDYEGWYAAQLHNIPEKLILLCDDHDRLVNAMGERDQDKAQQILCEHVEHCLQVLAENLQAASYPIDSGDMGIN